MSSAKARSSPRWARSTSSPSSSGRPSTGPSTPPRGDAFLLVQDARVVRRAVDVLAQQLAVPQREDVDAVPLDPLAVGPQRVRGPLADGEAVARVQRACAEAQGRPALEDARDVLPRSRRAFRPLPGGVV